MDLSTDLIDNQGLFTDHYLEEVLGSRPDVDDLVEDADNALERAQERYEEKKSELAKGTNEEQTENRFIRPILNDVLDWSFIVRETVQGEGESYGEPDYALFSDPQVRDEVSEEASDGEYNRIFRSTTALAEAKRWHLSLEEGGEPVSGDKAPSEGTPGAQVLRYFQWTGVPWGILTNGNKWRLYTSRVPSPVDTYLELNLERILEQPHGTEEDPKEARSAFRLFYLLFRAESFRENPALGKPFIDAVFEESVDRGRELEDELTERVFDEVFITLATGFFEDWCDGEDKVPSEEVLDSIYKATLRLLYRLLFLLYAEDRDLLPVHDRRGYYQYSLSRIAKDAREKVHESQVIIGDDLWGELQLLFGEVISTGEPRLNVPTYNGDLFDVGSGENAWLDQHTVPDEYLAPALTDLTLVDPDDPDSRGVDYKALDVRQLGSVYEGLLEHRLRCAEEDKALVKKNGTEVYKPHSALSSSESPSSVVEKGDLYLETDESKRKKTGSYYTPHYIVEFIVEEALGPVLNERIERFEDVVEEIGEVEAGQSTSETDTEPETEELRRQARDALLSIRVCDPAMGSGHFLVHAVDYMTNRIGAAALDRGLEINPIREVLDETREEILESLSNQDVEVSSVEDQLDDFTLLRRIVMKRCVYGVDIHQMAVELSQLSLWLRSFTIGAPLSFLKHHLKQGNSLVGTTTDELKGAVLHNEEGQFEMLGQRLSDRLEEITEQAQEIVQLADATLGQVRRSAKRFREYKKESLPLKRVLDLWLSRKFGNEDAEKVLNQAPRHVLDVFENQAAPHDEEQKKVLEAAIDEGEERSFFHWELEFPEVYLGGIGEEQRAGFDAVVGNPPWVNIGQASGNEEIISYARESFESAEYQIDLYTLFLERGLTSVREEGILGMIVPNPWLGNLRTPKIRKLTLVENRPLGLMQTPMSAFPGVAAEHLIALVQGGEECESGFQKGEINEKGEIKQSEYFECELLREEDGYVVFSSPDAASVIKRLEENSEELGELYSTVRGVGPYHHSVQDDEVIDSRAYHADHKKDDTFVPELKGKHLSRYTYNWDDDTWISYGEWLAEPRDKKVFNGKRLLLREILGQRFRACVIEEEFVVDRGIYIALQEEHEVDLHYALALIESSLLVYWFQEKYNEKDEIFPKLRVEHFNKLPIREVEFTLSEKEREARVGTLIDQYETAREKNARPDDNAILDATDDCLSADSERTGVLHDLLSRLARKMQGLKEKRQTFNLDITDYIPEDPSENQGVGLRDIGRYQPAEDIHDTLLADKTGERTKLRVDRLIAEKSPAADESYKVEIQVVAGFKPEGGRESWPDAVPEDAEPDEHGYVETHPIDVCTLHDCDKIESGLAVHWMRALDDADPGFSEYRKYAKKTISPLDRLHSLRIPDPSDENTQDAVKSFLSNLEQAEEINEQIDFTDQLVDQVVYKLYGLTDDEIRIVEQTV